MKKKGNHCGRTERTTLIIENFKKYDLQSLNPASLKPLRLETTFSVVTNPFMAPCVSPLKVNIIIEINL